MPWSAVTISRVKAGSSHDALSSWSPRPELWSAWNVTVRFPRKLELEQLGRMSASASSCLKDGHECNTVNLGTNFGLPVLHGLPA
jgi:hypothetical protein